MKSICDKTNRFSSAFSIVFPALHRERCGALDVGMPIIYDVQPSPFVSRSSVTTVPRGRRPDVRAHTRDARFSSFSILRIPCTYYPTLLPLLASFESVCVQGETFILAVLNNSAAALPCGEIGVGMCTLDE